jgi:hypothetical protein
MRENSTTKKVRGEKRHGGKSTGNKILVHVVIAQFMFLAEYPFKRHP